MPSSPGAAPWRLASQLAAAAGWRRLGWLAVLAVVQALLPLLGLLALQQLIDAVAAGVGGRMPADDARSAALAAVALAAAVAFLGNALRSASTVASENHGRALADASTRRVQAHAAHVALANHDRPAFHELMLRAGAEAGQRPVRLVQDALAVLVAGLGLGTMVWLLAGVSWWLPGLVALTSLPLAYVRRRHADLRVRWQEANAGGQRDVGYAGAVMTGRASAKELRTLGTAGFWLQRLDRLRADLRQSLAGLARRRGRDELAVQTFASLGLFAAYYALASDALAGGLTLGGLVLQAQAAQRAQNGVRDLLAALAGVHEHRRFLQPVGEFLAIAPELGERSPSTAPPPDGELAFADVTFAYPEAPQPALAGVSFALPAGARVLVLGHNGSGKSTLVKLLARLYPPTHGAVRCGDRDLREVDADSWRDHVAVLLQDAQLFELTVRDNLMADDASCWRVLELVGLAERVRALPAGLDTMCSRRHAGGVEWSVGEARRLVLARTLARKAAIYVLDEPLLALDRGAAEQVARALRAHAPEATLVVVDHRPEALQAVDRAIVLERGRLVAAGSVAELRASSPQFRALAGM
jgi:ATP-binding cassette subfamily B protein